MIDTLLEIPVHVRGRLASALESGLLVRDRTLAATTVIHFRTLIEKDLLRRLPNA